jgi:hypothetical protein
MGAYSNEIHAKMQNAVLGGVAYTAESTVKLRLCTTAPTAGSNGTQVSTSAWTNYAALSITNNTTNFPNAAVANPSTKSNGTLLDFTSGGVAVISGADVDLAGAELWNNAETERIAWTAFATTRTVQNGDEVKFAVGALDFSLAAA